jgi:hypothetical protein
MIEEEYRPPKLQLPRATLRDHGDGCASQRVKHAGV